MLMKRLILIGIVTLCYENTTIGVLADEKQWFQK